MSENSKIEWTDHTFNPWEGCQKVGPGCDHCYAETRNARFAGGIAVNWGPGAPRRRTSAANWQQPLRWDKNHEAFFAQHGRRQRVFCASLADVFDNAVDPQWRQDLFALIQRTPNLDWLLARPAFTVGANEGSVLFSKLCRELLIEGLTFHDARATALTHLAKRVDVLTLAKISRHKDLSLLSNVYYRERAETIAARI